MIIRRKKVAGALLYLVALGILLALGSWQFQRGREKATIEAAIDEDAPVVEISAAPADWSAIAYREALLSGRWQAERSFLLGSRIHQGVSGAEVLSPFQLDGGGTVLVNRGWVAGDGAIELASPPADAAPRGILYLPQPGFTLGETLVGDRAWPQPVLYLDIPALADRLGSPLETAVLVLDADHQAAFESTWQPTTIPAMRHYGYAVQWWGLAVTLLVFGIIWQRKRKPKKDT